MGARCRVLCGPEDFESEKRDTARILKYFESDTSTAFRISEFGIRGRVYVAAVINKHKQANKDANIVRTSEASLVLPRHPKKPNRPRRTRYRGSIMIHASTRVVYLSQVSKDSLHSH